MVFNVKTKSGQGEITITNFNRAKFYQYQGRFSFQTFKLGGYVLNSARCNVCLI